MIKKLKCSKKQKPDKRPKRTQVDRWTQEKALCAIKAKKDLKNELWSKTVVFFGPIKNNIIYNIEDIKEYILVIKLYSNISWTQILPVHSRSTPLVPRSTLSNQIYRIWQKWTFLDPIGFEWYPRSFSPPALAFLIACISLINWYSATKWSIIQA